MDLFDIDFCCMELYDKHFRPMEVNPGVVAFLMASYLIFRASQIGT